MLQQKNTLTLIAIIVIIVALGVVIWGALNIFKKENGEESIEEETSTEEAASSTHEEVPKDIVVPEVGAEVEEGVAVPETVTEAAPGAEAKFRRFEIKAENNRYTPSTVIVNKGDIVRINFTAVDKKYDFVFPDYGMKQVAEPGETKKIGFQAVTEGKFLFYSDLYGGLEGEMKGYIIIK